MDEQKRRALYYKIMDYKRFSFIFLCISAFLYLGSTLPFNGKTMMKTEALMLSSFALLAVSMIFYWRMRVAKADYEKDL
ncbi:YrhC family protein [Camelliibacillus cellulosilyticus]|uniref:YrhC family protein n=1 Tax=Camelliibacillus cellulosilyticus TaxID=2174486 RepID=A0ABV9GJE4_9BACL